MCSKCSSLQSQIVSASNRSTYAVTTYERLQASQEFHRLVAKLDAMKSQHRIEELKKQQNNKKSG